MHPSIQTNLGMLQHIPALQEPVLNIAPRTEGGHTATATAVDWFPVDSGAFLSVSKDCTAKLWDPNAAAVVAEFATATPAHTMRMAPSAHPVAAVGCDDGCIRLLDVAAGVTCNTLMGTPQAPLLPHSIPLPVCSHLSHAVAVCRRAVAPALCFRRNTDCRHPFPPTYRTTGPLIIALNAGGRRSCSAVGPAPPSPPCPAESIHPSLTRMRALHVWPTCAHTAGDPCAACGVPRTLRSSSAIHQHHHSFLTHLPGMHAVDLRYPPPPTLVLPIGVMYACDGRTSANMLTCIGQYTCQWLALYSTAPASRQHLYAVFGCFLPAACCGQVDGRVLCACMGAGLVRPVSLSGAHVQGERAGYGGPVLSIAWCGVNEHQLVGGDATGELRLWDMRRSGTVHTFDQHDADEPLDAAGSDAESGGDDGRCGGRGALACVETLPANACGMLCESWPAMAAAPGLASCMVAVAGVLLEVVVSWESVRWRGCDRRGAAVMVCVSFVFVCLRHDDLACSRPWHACCTPGAESPAAMPYAWRCCD